MDLTLPLDYAAIERILPHRYPFLLVDRIIELEVDKRIVGIKNVSLNERYLSHATNASPVLPPTILTEAVAQVGAILVLAKPENRQRLPFFAGIERVRYRRPVHPGDVVVIEANVIVERRGTRRRQTGHRRDDDFCLRTSSTVPAFVARDVQPAQREPRLK
jgi:3-hydroxyacyl-[acyl-carrier-protein] dehydratase